MDIETIKIDGRQPLLAKIQTTCHDRQGKLRYIAIDLGKVYKVRLNDGKEGKDATYFVAKKMFLEGMSEEDIKSAYGEVLPKTHRSKSYNALTKKSRGTLYHSWSDTKSFLGILEC